MMKNNKLKNIVYRWGGVVASCAIFVTTYNTNVRCALVMHQPELPESAKKLRKF